MMLGWSDGGSPGLRATHADRDAVRRIVDLALEEGRLDPVEHEQRLLTVASAKARGRLAAVVADLPARRNERDWVDGARIRAADRHLAAGVLSDAASAGRLTPEEYTERVLGLGEAVTYDGLARILHGLPDWPRATEADLRPAEADRDAALAELSRAVADGRLEPGEHEALAAEIASAGLVGGLAAVTGRLHERASDADRSRVAGQLAAALDDGRLDHGKYETRAGRAASARTTADLGRLTQDLTGRSRRLSNADRAETAALLKSALDDGRLDLDEYDSRLKAAYAAKTVAQTRPLLADLAVPARPAWRGPLDRLFDAGVHNSALLPRPRHWWGRLHPKPLWKLGFIAVLAAWGWGIAAGGTVLLGLTVGGGWVPVVALLLGIHALAHIGAKEVQARTREVIAGIARELGTRPEARTCKAEFGDGTVTVGFHPAPGVKGVPDALFDEAVRLCWQSRLYPLSGLTVTNREETRAGRTEGTSRTERFGPHETGLRHRYGPRPYGWMPADAD
ncbi:DUF1707 domain-containing protein [Phytomonospora sp. NPDC050363]|uniref:DUF1707 domain-containing protein n=1 Tax=Phytomonospora sp. NPDC050363 TaxID=3155642 RepID=UPI0033E3AB6C